MTLSQFIYSSFGCVGIRRIISLVLSASFASTVSTQDLKNQTLNIKTHLSDIDVENIYSCQIIKKRQICHQKHLLPYNGHGTTDL